MMPPAQPLDEWPAGDDSSPSHFALRQYTPAGITAAWPIVVTITDHGLVMGQALRATKFVTMPFAVATGMEQLNNRLFYVGRTTTNTFQLVDVDGVGIDGRNYTAYVDGGEFTLTGPTLPIVNPAPEPPSGVPPFPPE